MFNFSLLVNKGIGVLPSRSAWAEAYGFGLFGVGALIALSQFSYSPSDYNAIGDVVAITKSIDNLAGRFGAVIAKEVLGHFGVVGWLWPAVMMIWGFLVALGFVLFPSAKRIAGLIVTMIILAAISEIQFVYLGMVRPDFGFGGSIGVLIGSPVQGALGYGGGVIVLLSLLVVSLVLSGNLVLSNTASYIRAVVDFSTAVCKKVWNKYILERVSEKKAIEVAVAEARAARTSTKKSLKKQDIEELVEDTFDEVLSQTKEHIKANKKADEGENSSLTLNYRGKTHAKPSVGIFAQSNSFKVSGPEHKKLVKQAANLVKQLELYKIHGKMAGIKTGPIVTTFEFAPAAGTKSSKIVALSEDLARLLQAKSLRVLAPIPGKSLVGFEVPNAEKKTIGFGSLIDNVKFKSRKILLPVAMGVDTFGKAVIEDLTKMPHLLVAGSTGSGKSVFMNTLIASLVTRHSAKDLRLIMIDPKMVEMTAFNPLPHMACEVVTDPIGEGKKVLDELVIEMEERYNKMLSLGAKNIASYNETIAKSKKSAHPKFKGKWQKFSYVVLVIDELADMMMTLGKEAETPITRLAQKARAAGIHLVIATQRPSADVVTGLIKANFPTRVAFRVLSGIDSRTILDSSGAETLLGMGDMLFLGANGTARLHGAYLSDAEVERMVSTCK